MKNFRKILSWILIFVLIFGQLSAPITVLAQEATQSAQPSEPTPEATNSATPADPTPIPSTQPTETPTLTSTASPSATPTAEASSLASSSMSKREPPIINKVTEKAGEGRDKRWVEGEVIVKFKKDKTNLRSILGDIKASAFESKHGLEQIDKIKDLNITVQKDDKPTQQLISELERDPDVEYVEPNYYLKPRSLPNDTDFEKLWALHNTGQNIVGTDGTSDADIDAPEAWDLETTSQQDVIVAIIDSGVNYNHPDLKDNMWDGASCKDENNNLIAGGCPNHGWDFENDDSNPIDDNGHGSHIAGTIAAVQNNSKGISGVSSKNNIKIMALKFGYTYTTVANEIRAINFAKNNGAKVINASYGGWAPSQAEKDAIANFPGLFVAAAGNTPTDNDITGDTPSGYDNENIIAVAATDNKDNLANFSSYGKNLVDVGAPGVNIYSTTFEIIPNELNKQSFEDVTVPNIPSGFTKTGDWGTAGTNSSYGNILYGDLFHRPYIPNADSNFTSPKFNMSSYPTARINFVTVCDTQKSPNGAYTDYMSLEVSADGTNFTKLRRWDEMDLPAIGGVTTHTGGYLYVDIPASYLTPNFTYRFRWITNGDNDIGSVGDGCFIDDVKLENVTAGGEKYEYISGTSMATPHVVGEAAMILSYKPNLTTSQIKDTVLNTGDLLPALQGKTVSGKRINLNNALRSNTQSSNANLSNLTVNQGALTPNFSPSITTYAVSVGDNISSITVTPTAEDAKSTIKVNNVVVASGATSSPINLNAGNNTIAVLVTAESGATKTYTINVNRTNDITAPTITINSPAAAARVSGISILQFTVNEPAEVKCSLDNHVFKKCSSSDTFASLDLFNNFIDGPLTVYIQAEDLAGNIGATDRGFIKDTYIPLPPSAPTSQAGPLINNQEYTNGFLVVVPLPNDVKPNHLIKIYLNTDHEFISDTITQNHINAQKYTFAVSKNSLEEDGAKIFTARLIDHLGRLSPLSNPLTLTLDTVSPALTYVSIRSNNANSTWAKVGDTITLQFIPSEDLGKNPQVSIHESIVSVSKTNNTYTASRIIAATDQEMVTTFEINFEDGAGNKGEKVNSTTDQTSVTIDKTRPVLKLIRSPDTAIANSNYTLGFEYADINLSSKEYRLDGGNWTDYSKPLTVTSEGNHTFEARVTDKAANISSKQTGFRINKTVPQAVNDTYTAIKNTPVTIDSAGLLINDTDPGGDTLSITEYSSTENGQVEITESGVTFTPVDDFIGTGKFTYTVSDGLNTATGWVYVVITPNLNNNQTVIQPILELSQDKTSVVVVNVPFDTVINVPGSVGNATLNLSNLISSTETGTSANITSKINVNAATSIGSVSLQIPSSITILGPASWTGIINAPQVQSNASATPWAETNKIVTTFSVIEVGAADLALTFDKAVRILVPGQAGKLAGFQRGATFTKITTICDADSQATADSLGAGAECYINIGSDLAIWTKHFTRFVTYTETALPAVGGSSSTSSSGSSSSSNSGASVCTDVKPGSAPKLLSAVASGANEVTLTWSKAGNPVTYYLVAYGLEKGKMQFGNPNVGDKNTTAYKVKGLSGGTNYYFKVRAGNHCMPGEFSNELSAKASGSTTIKPAEGFNKGVLSTSKIESAKPTPVPSGIQPASNVLNVIKDFLLRLLSNLQSLSYLPSLRPLTRQPG